MILPAHYRQLKTSHFITNKINGNRSLRLILCKIRNQNITIEFKSWGKTGKELEGYLATLD